MQTRMIIKKGKFQGEKYNGKRKIERANRTKETWNQYRHNENAIPE